MVLIVINTSDLTDTQSIIDRIYSDEPTRKKLLNQAARFFRSQDTILGLDAESLLHEAILAVLRKGFPHKDHIGYLMKTIRNQGIQRVHRRLKTDMTAKTASAKARLMPMDPLSGVEETVIDRLEQDISTETVRSALEALPANVRRVAKAKIEYPDHSDTEIASALGVSRSTVLRAKRFMKEDPTLRGLTREAPRDHHNGNQLPLDRRRTP